MGSDNYIRYVILLTKTPAANRNDAIIRRHVEYLRDLDRQGKLVLCGPFLDYEGGMVVVKAASVDEAKELAACDPFVREGHRTFEVRTWQLSCEENNHLGAG
jgi:uncharacterized protein YciI